MPVFRSNQIHKLGQSRLGPIRSIKFYEYLCAGASIRIMFVYTSSGTLQTDSDCHAAPEMLQGDTER